MRKEKPLPRSKRGYYSGKFFQIPSIHNRGLHTRRSSDQNENIKIDLEDIDVAIDYQFKNVIKPRIKENNIMVPVNIMYGNPERWKAAQRDGFIRDKKGKIITPLIMYSRTSIAKDDQIPVDKLDRNVLYSFEKSWSEKNRYDRFSLLTNQRMVKEFFNVAIPDYVILNYECIAWTSYIIQMNEIVQQILYSEGSFWGDPYRFKFAVRIDSFDQAVDVSTEQERAIKLNFTLSVRAYLVPEHYNNLITTQKSFSPCKVLFGTETEVDPNIIKSGIYPVIQQKKTPITSAKEGMSVEFVPKKTLDIDPQADELETLAYLLKEKHIKATSVIGNNGLGQTIAIFQGESVVRAPTGVPTTDKYDFLFFCNGAHIEFEAIVIFRQIGNQVRLVADIAELGYSFEETDEVFAWGQFEA